VVAVSSFDELARLGARRCRAKSYSTTSLHRLWPDPDVSIVRPLRAAALGAVAALVRSVTPLAIELPHTGEMSYDENQPKIQPRRVSGRCHDDRPPLCERVPVQVHLEMGAHMEPDADSGDVVGEIPAAKSPKRCGDRRPHRFLDVGKGAQDDGRPSWPVCRRCLNEQTGPSAAPHHPRAFW